MKSRVKFSVYSMILTVVISVVLVLACEKTYGELVPFCIVLALCLMLIVPALFYAPLSVRANERCIIISSLLKKHHISLNDIVRVEPFTPTMGARRLFGSGGFFGYWGIFKEGDVGRYAAYFGKASDCFLVRMKNGDKYVIGCAGSPGMVNFIKRQIG